MLFSSIPFLYYFLPAVIGTYFLLPWLVEKVFSTSATVVTTIRNLILLAFSLVFYAWGEPKYVFLMIATIALFYSCGIAVGYSKRTAMKKFWLVVSVAVSLSLLAIFKYADFFISSVNAVTGLNMTLLRLALPIGISFYTFQCLSYTIDVYRGTAKVQKNPINFGA